MSSSLRATDAAGAPQLSDAHLALARRHAPIVRFGDNEPFLPSRVGITVLTKPGRSPSAPLDIAFEPRVTKVIEYAIWWDWDIQHLYELEHVWVKLDAADTVLSVNASAHGGLFAMHRADGSPPIEDGRVTLFSTPGKHAFTATEAEQAETAEQTTVACQELAGRGRILINDMFGEALSEVTPQDHRAVKRYLQARAFLPSFNFDQRIDLANVDFSDWGNLAAWIPGRVRTVLAQVRAEQPLLKAIFLDSGDTLVNEATEKFDADGYVIEAGLIPGALDMMRSLAEDGYLLALVADGRVRSFDTVLGSHGINSLFHAQVISEAEGVEKPDRRMFHKAMTLLGLDDSDADAIVMVGNHLERDIGGANQLGIISIWQSWSKKRSHIPACENEVPHYTIRSPGELPGLLADIELLMGRTKSNPSPE